MEAWYFTALPYEFHGKCLYVCDFCLQFFIQKKEFKRHSKKCLQRQPPGDEIYREEFSEKEVAENPELLGIAFFEVNGSHEKIYCENLSYISRMFLDHKNLN